MIAIGSALVKDSFEGPDMGKVLSITQALVFIAPVAVPILGALILEVSDTANLLLNAQKENIGAASAVMNFGFTLLGSLGMVIGSGQWASYVSGIA